MTNIIMLFVEAPSLLVFIKIDVHESVIFN